MTGEDISRRGWLTSGLAAIAATVAASVLPRAAQAASGDPLLLGQDNVASGRTKVTNDTSNAPAIEAETTGSGGAYEGAPSASIRGVTSGSGRGVFGMATADGDGIVGTSVSGTGVIGRSGSNVGVFGGSGIP